MTNKIVLLFLSLGVLSVNIIAQPLTVSNVTTAGRFNTCNMGLPLITATLISATGSSVSNGTIICVDREDSTFVNVTISNIRWSQGTDHNWIHGIFLPANAGVTITETNFTLPAWVYSASGCTAGACTSVETGTRGFYFAGTMASCCPNGGNTPNPCDNWGDPAASCTAPMSFSFKMKIRNSSLFNNLQFRIRGTADGTTGCWGIADATTPNMIMFQINSTPCTPDPFFCNPAGTNSFNANVAGSAYQWQLSIDSINYNNISDNIYYSGTNTNTLTLTNASSQWYGYRYRSISDGINGQVHTLKFKNTWTGAINSNWATAGNWSCNTVPDENTDVFINSGTVILNANTTIRSLTLNPTATLTINSGVVLTITH